MQVKLIDIFLLFLKLGGMIFGGGIVIVPLLEAEAVNKRKWITYDELIEFYSISQLIPGINIPDVSMFIGYKLRGKAGATVAGLGVILIPFILIVSLSFFLGTISHLSMVKSALWGIGIGTIVILSTAARSMWKVSIVDKISAILFILVFLAIFFNLLSPVWVVFIALILGVVRGFLIKDNEVTK
jgi:chromate transporter